MLGGALALTTGYLLAAVAQTLLHYAVVYGLLIGLGTSATFAPLLADISHWFVRRRGIAVALCASGTYLGGALWPPVIEGYVRDTCSCRAQHEHVHVKFHIMVSPSSRPRHDASFMAWHLT